MNGVIGLVVSTTAFDAVAFLLVDAFLHLFSKRERLAFPKGNLLVETQHLFSERERLAFPKGNLLVETHRWSKPQLTITDLVKRPFGLGANRKQMQLCRDILDNSGMKRVFENAGANLLMVVVVTREYDKIDAGPRVQDKYQLLQRKIDRLPFVIRGKTLKASAF